ncbi:T9SS type A sorting domain-containing protein, partial [uncultured Nostoc sp.]|uniref:T9SS type A sorting domain-containing protein n=1 Tax=uncultured Nostoc sp. TaxID=340711 RepID=UPI0035CA0FB3
AENLGAQLNWQTSLETNNDHFEIQRSRDAKGFEAIGRVQGKGTTNQRNDYSFTDVDMFDQVSYYRIKQVDFDGSTHFSTIISISRQDSRQWPGSITLGPVPTSGTLTLQLSAGKTINELIINDLHGQRVVSHTVSQATTDVDVSFLPAGVYLLNVLTTDGQHLHTRFVKQ